MYVWPLVHDSGGEMTAAKALECPRLFGELETNAPKSHINDDVHWARLRWAIEGRRHAMLSTSSCHGKNRPPGYEDVTFDDVAERRIIKRRIPPVFRCRQRLG